jgi:hypothetical protein
MVGDSGPGTSPVDSMDEPVRPNRPAAIELAAALLIVGGGLGVLGLIATDAQQPAGLEWLAVLTLVLNVAQIVVGVLVRIGRFWIVAVNYVAVLGFLDFRSASVSPLGLMLGLTEVVVLVILIIHRSWFDRRWAEPSR